jgi:acetyl-CoA carboxylase biotin carboxyl carrier protein
VGDEASNIPSPFDVRTIKYLVRLMSHHDLSEIDLREGDLRIRLRRGAADVPVVQTVVPAATTAAVAQQAVPQPPKTEQTAIAQTGKQLPTIKSPTPGTFYSAPTPDAQPFVQVGARVTPSTVVCVIEAMKIFNEITADCAGVITEICVENQQAVEYNQVLFKVDPTA